MGSARPTSAAANLNEAKAGTAAAAFKEMDQKHNFAANPCSSDTD